MKGGGDSEELKRTDEGTAIAEPTRRGGALHKSVVAVRCKVGGRSVMVGEVVVERFRGAKVDIWRCAVLPG